MNKRKEKSPRKICQYGEQCFRVNPNHLNDFSHPHLDKILETKPNKVTGEYEIPENLSGYKKIQEQLKILAGKQYNAENPSKVQKLDNTEPMTSTSMPNKELKNSVADFFKERSRMFAAKEPQEMRALSPTPSVKIEEQVEMPVINTKLRQFIPVIRPIGKMAAKLEAAAPYNVFLTTVTSAPATHSDPLSVTFLEILDPSLGELESSVQLNFTVDINWLLAQYQAAKVSHLPLTILYGQEDATIRDVNHVWKNIHTFMIQVPTKMGCHHAKVMLLFYKDKSMRIVVSTANLYKDDWDNRVQGIWISDKLRDVADETKGESVTHFKQDLIDFLINYKNPKIDAYIDRIKKSDFSSIKVFMITSIPGAHRNCSFGHRRLAYLLSKYSAPIDVKHPIIMQSSSLGNFGKSAAEYLTGEIAQSMKKHSEDSNSSPAVKLIYPSLKNVEDSHDGMMGGGCLPYYRDAHTRQPWLNKYLYQWKCTSRNRDRAMPHIKSYCRYSDEGLFWFVLTSANISKSAWGVTRNNSLNINSYEVGIAFFPRTILSGKNFIPTNEDQQKDETPIFKLPFDIPPVAYEQTDAPFCIQDMQEYVDSLMAMQM